MNGGEEGKRRRIGMREGGGGRGGKGRGKEQTRVCEARRRAFARRRRGRERGKVNLCEYVRMRVCEGMKERVRIGGGGERGGTYGNRKMGFVLIQTFAYNLPPTP